MSALLEPILEILIHGLAYWTGRALVFVYWLAVNGLQYVFPSLRRKAVPTLKDWSRTWLLDGGYAGPAFTDAGFAAIGFVFWAAVSGALFIIWLRSGG